MCMYIHAHVRMCACVHVCVHVCMCACVVHVCTKLGPLGMRYSSSVMPDPSSNPVCVGVHVSTQAQSTQAHRWT